MAETVKKKSTPAKTGTKNGKNPANGAAKAAKPRKASATKATSSKVTEMPVPHEEIARLAHRYWAERGHQDGHHMEDWLRAEQELSQKAS